MFPRFFYLYNLFWDAYPASSIINFFGHDKKKNSFATKKLSFDEFSKFNSGVACFFLGVKLCQTKIHNTVF